MADKGGSIIDFLSPQAAGAMEDLKAKRLANAEATTRQDYLADILGGYKPSQGIFWNSGRPDLSPPPQADGSAPAMVGAGPVAPGAPSPLPPVPPIKSAPLTPFGAQLGASPQAAFLARAFGPDLALKYSTDMTNVTLPDGSRQVVPKFAVSSLPAGSQLAENAKPFDPADIAFVRGKDGTISGVNKAGLPGAIAGGATPVSQEDLDLLTPSIFKKKVELAQAPSQALPATFEPTAQKAAAEANEAFAKDLEAQASQARTGLGDLELLRQARANFKQTGALGEYAGKVAQLASALGIPNTDQAGGAAQLLDSLATKMGITYRPPGTRMTQIEFQKFRQAVPGITMSDDPADIAIAMKEAEYNHAIQANSKVQQSRGQNGALPGNIRAQITPFQDTLSDEQKAIAQKFGLRTAAKQQAQSAAQSNAAQPPAGVPPDAKIGTDPQGKQGWYTPDPARPGKFIYHGPVSP